MNAIRYPTSTAALRVMRGSAVGIHGRPAGGRRRRNVKSATVGTTTTPKRDSIMYPAVNTILRLVGGYTGDRLAKSTGGFSQLVIV